MFARPRSSGSIGSSRRARQLINISLASAAGSDSNMCETHCRLMAGSAGCPPWACRPAAAGGPERVEERFAASAPNYSLGRLWPVWGPRRNARMQMQRRPRKAGRRAQSRSHCYYLAAARSIGRLAPPGSSPSTDPGRLKLQPNAAQTRGPRRNWPRREAGQPLVAVRRARPALLLFCSTCQSKSLNRKIRT